MEPATKKRKLPEGKKGQAPVCFFFAGRYSIPKDKDMAWALGSAMPEIHKFLKIIGAKKWQFQLEDSHMEKSPEEIEELYKKSGMPVPPHNMHFQMAWQTEKRKRASQLINIVNSTPLRGMYIKPASAAGKQALMDYCMKTETRLQGPWTDSPVYRGADLISTADLTPWQKQVLDMILWEKPGNRATYWFYCPHGGSGKSALAKYLAYHHDIPTFTYAKAWDILYLASVFSNKKAYIYNLSKSKPSEISSLELYAAIEAIKDGHFTSLKYKPKQVLMNRSHSIVFANVLPSRESMTRKRFHIFTLEPLDDALVEEPSLIKECKGMRMATEQDYIDEEIRNATVGKETYPNRGPVTVPGVQRAVYDAPYVRPLEAGEMEGEYSPKAADWDIINAPDDVFDRMMADRIARAKI